VAAVENLVQFNVGLPGQSGKPERVYGQLVSPDYFSAGDGSASADGC